MPGHLPIDAGDETPLYLCAGIRRLHVAYLVDRLALGGPGGIFAQEPGQVPSMPLQPRAPFLADNSGQGFLHFGNMRLPVRGLFKSVLRPGIAVEREVRAGPIDRPIDQAPIARS